MKLNNTDSSGLLLCPEHGVTAALWNTIHQTARCHNQESANPHIHCRHSLITAQLWVQFCRCRWPCGLRPLDYRDRGFETRWRHGCCVLCLLYVVQVAACVTGLSLIQGSLTGCVCHLETSTVWRSRSELRRSGTGKKELCIIWHLKSSQNLLSRQTNCVVLKRFCSKPKWMGCILRQICAVCTHDGKSQLFDKQHYYCSHKSLPLVSIISYLNPLDTLPHYIFNIQCNILPPFMVRLSPHIFR